MHASGDLQVFDPILSGFSVGFKDQNLYADRLYPRTRVNTRNGRYRVFDGLTGCGRRMHIALPVQLLTRSLDVSGVRIHSR